MRSLCRWAETPVPHEDAQTAGRPFGIGEYSGGEILGLIEFRIGGDFGRS